MEKMEKAMPMERKSGGMRGLLFIIVLIVLVLVVLWWFGKLPVGDSSSSGSYQAVFLTNNQVYFGKLSNANSQYPVLTDIYYLQVTQTLQPSTQNPQQNLNLVKLGNELHGPMDKMVLNRDHIMFYEDLKADSEIVKLINEQGTNQ